MNEADVAVVKKAYEAYGRGDTEAVVAAVAPDAHWEFVGRREEHAPFGPRRGPEGAREFFKALIENDEFSEFTPTEFHPSGDKLFVLGHAEGRVKTTGQPFSGDWCTFSRSKAARSPAGGASWTPASSFATDRRGGAPDAAPVAA